MRRHPLSAALACALFLCASCGTSTSRGADSSTITFALSSTPAEGVASFVVDVTGLRIARAGGSPAAQLDRRLRLDLAELGELARVLEVFGVEPALYDRVELTLELGSASCHLVGQNAPAALFDGDGLPLAGALRLEIEVRPRIEAIAARHRLVELDLDLARSLELDGGANSARFEPIFALHGGHGVSRELLVAGEVLAADVQSRRVLTRLASGAGPPYGAVSVQIEASTLWQIGGLPLQGDGGLAALAGSGPGTPVRFRGRIMEDRRRVLASYVEAGAFSQHAASDWVEGHVVGRIGAPGGDATLTVLGHGSLGGVALFGTSFQLATSSTGTLVLREASVEILDTDALAVGQRVRAFGSASGTLLDAHAGLVRILPAQVRGLAAGPPSDGSLTLELALVGPLDAQLFAWPESGPTPPDPDALVLAVGAAADVSGITFQTPVAAWGSFEPIDEHGADFAATQVEDLSAAPYSLVVRDRDAGFQLEPSIAADGLLLGIAGESAEGEVLRLDQGFAGEMALPIEPPPRLVPPSEGALLYSIRDRDDGSAQAFEVYGEFAAALATRLALGAVLYDVTAIGSYQAGANILTARVLGVVVD